MYGTCLIVTQNFAVSGANQVLLNMVNGGFYNGNIMVLSPSSGPFEKLFQAAGCAVRIGSLDSLLRYIRDIRLVVCNTIMTAHVVVDLANRGIPHMWILHEWWPRDMMVRELSARKVTYMDASTVDHALQVCSMVICVCRAQADVYPIKCPKQIVYVGVPDPRLSSSAYPSSRDPSVACTFLCMGIVCPRKNQVTVVKLFKKFAGDRQDVRLVIVGVRKIRDYEIEYVNEVEEVIAGDPRISLHDVTNDPDSYYRTADALVFASLNEVTPLVLPEAMLRRLPVITTGIAGIPEIVKHEEHGFILDPDDEDGFVQAMAEIADNPELRSEMGFRAEEHAKEHLTLDCMNDRYASIARTLSPICILLDMDGCVVDWDSGFRAAWGDRSDIDRTKSYAMELCVPPKYKKEATGLFCSKGFFASLPAMPGSLDAIREMGALPGVSLLLCTSPVLASSFCHQEKAQWVKERLGDEWLTRLIITSDKTKIRGDLLIDDKPYITGSEYPAWEHVLFTAPYNSELPVDGRYRLDNWEEWRRVLSRALERVGYRKVAEDVAAKLPLGMSRSRAGLSSLLAGEWSSASLVSMATTPSERRPPPTKEDVANLPDFSEELKALGMYRDDYMNWRKGGHKGAKGEVHDVLANVSRMLLERAVLDQADDPTEIHVTRLNYRTGYHNWRRGKPQGARHHDAPAVAAN